MSKKTNTVEALETRRLDLLAQAKAMKKAIAQAQKKEREDRAKALLSALEKEGLLDADPAAIRAALAAIKPAAKRDPAPPEEALQLAESGLQ